MKKSAIKRIGIAVVTTMLITDMVGNYGMMTAQGKEEEGLSNVYNASGKFWQWKVYEPFVERFIPNINEEANGMKEEQVSDVTATDKESIVVENNVAENITEEMHIESSMGSDDEEYEEETNINISTYDKLQSATEIATETEAQWKLVWSDEFDGAKLDETKWSYQIGNGYNGWGNNEKQYYKKENVIVSDGTLKITAKKENTNGFEYTSSRIRTVTDNGDVLFSTKYGRIEARIKLPAGTGLWPAFWMMPVDSEYGSWPLSGEIDIMEARGRVVDKVSGAIHFGESRPFNKQMNDTYTFAEGTDITEFHTYAVEWKENVIIWYVDGVEYFRTSNWYTMNNDVVADYPAPFNKDFYIILNMAVGGNYDNSQVPEDSVLPGTMEVDYVRVYHDNNGYKEALVTMPVGTRDDEAMKNTPIYSGGNLLSDIDFEGINEEIIYSDEADYASHNWFFVKNRYFEGDAALTKQIINNKTYVNIDILNVGTQSYAVQLQQLLPLAKGYVYKVKFEAMSLGGDRTIKVKPVGSTSTHENYNSSYVANLTNELKTYEFSFMMNDETDMAAVLEFNLGQYDENVIIGNVLVTALGTYQGGINTDQNTENTPVEDNTAEEVEKEIIKSAVINGDFTDGTRGWSVLNTDNAVEIKNGSTYGKVYTKPKTNPWDKMMYQNGIYLTKGEKYTLEFKAKSSSSKQQFAVTIEDASYTQSLGEKFVVGKNWETFTYTFTADTDAELSLKYYLGMVTKECKLYLDDVSITWIGK